jgi:UDP-N-acetyl-2-amino-2-deoxyglucuronate dehydrogenase
MPDCRVSSSPLNFAITGVAGYIAPRHLKAIVDTGHRVVAAVDPHDAASILDRYSFETRFFTEFERFDRHLEKCRRSAAGGAVDYLAICSPNYLHDAHVRLALRVGAHAICEKPLVINPWNLDALEQLEGESGRRVYTVLQLRQHPSLQALKQRLDGTWPRRVSLTYVTARGPWYDVSWKGSPERSGGITANIGIHLFDLLLWIFGPVTASTVCVAEPSRMQGRLVLERADVEWFLSTDRRDLPLAAQAAGRSTFRSIRVDEQEIEFTDGFTDLHTAVYREVLAGRGLGIAEARPAIELAHRIRTAPVTPVRRVTGIAR